MSPVLTYTPAGCIYAYNAFPTGLMPELFTMIPCASHNGCPWDGEKWALESDTDLPPGFRSAREPKYILRPEAIESVFLLYRITGDETLRDQAWEMFESIVRATETSLAFSAIKDVNVLAGETFKEDSMEVSRYETLSFMCPSPDEYAPILRLSDSDLQQSFWMAETLKYFYLIFSPPDLISLDEYVFNTEAHPLRRPR